ncbi:MAG TPA: hypothetical protein VLF59_02790 [Candidatus Saccharimonadales bacterium]|nr:hypothetical protein [Candidatus Saccharimonadales bacterium]
MQRPKKSPHKGLFKPLALIVGLLVAVGLVFLVLELTNTTHIFHSRPQSKAIVTVGTPVTPKTSSGHTTQSGEKDLSTTNSQPGGATDTHGAADTTTDSGKWTVSQTGYITIKSPLADAKLQDGAVLAGSAKVDQVSYRLTDNAVGVVSQGQLNVTDGKFSGTLHFTPKGTGGRLDVFSTDPSGVEYNEVQINVSF